MTSTLPTAFAHEREWGIDGRLLDLARYEALSANWANSKRLFVKIKDLLSAALKDGRVQCVGAAGSLGRMEASDLSDADLIVVLDPKIPLASADATAAYETVWEALAPMGIGRPNAKGVFARPTNVTQLLERIGHTEEDLAIIGKRMLLLLETQPVFGATSFQTVIDALVDRYAKDYVKDDARKEWTFLLNDLIRYFRAICVHYQSTFDDTDLIEHDKWTLRNVKLRHSRLIMYAGLLALLGESSKIRDDKVSWLKNRLRWTPLERLSSVYESNEDWAFFRLAGLYAVFLGRLSRRRRCATGSRWTTRDRNKHRAFAELKANWASRPSSCGSSWIGAVPGRSASSST